MQLAEVQGIKEVKRAESPGDAALFCTTAEASSFKEVAARLGTSPQAITRAIKQLEAAIGEVLFHRNTRGIQITEFGTQLAE